MKALITGSLGFVGKYLREELERSGYEVVGLDLASDEHTLRGNILDAKEMKCMVEQISPHVVIHLAGQSNVALSWKIPQKTMEINVNGTLNLMEAIREVNPAIRMVVVGSSDQYGFLGKAGINVSEDLPTNPQTPYAVSKNAQEDLAKIYVKSYGMNICMTRSFNHGGAGQKEGFLIPDFVAGIVRIERGLQNTLRVGNLDSRRDFTHVSDVVKAYRLIAEHGLAGEIYNVGSGRTVSAQEILESLSSKAKCFISVEQDPERMRPSDTPVICCDHSKLTRDTGWEAELSVDMILEDVLLEWRMKEF